MNCHELDRNVIVALRLFALVLSVVVSGCDGDPAHEPSSIVGVATPSAVTLSRRQKVQFLVNFKRGSAALVAMGSVDNGDLFKAHNQPGFTYIAPDLPGTYVITFWPKSVPKKRIEAVVTVTNIGDLLSMNEHRHDLE